ncbi:MAG: hypothetical protein K2J38_06390 [Muribaculaceae bacterium]|nr:hypothetical protein [Muribaculaceae bacterium]
MNITLSQTASTRVRSFLWQHVLLLFSLYLMTLGVVLCIKSALGSSVISSIPFVLSLAGAENLAPALTVGDYTIAMNFVLVLCQILVLRRRFEYVQLFQLVIGFIFGWLIDLNAAILSSLECTTLPVQIAAQLAGCTIMGIGIAFEVRCGSVTMPGEGISIAVSQVTGRPFAKVKIYIDTLLVVLAVTASFVFFGRWLGSVIGAGTVFAMIYVGMVVKFTAGRIGWFDRVLHYVPGFRRYIFGLARFVRK